MLNLDLEVLENSEAPISNTEGVLIVIIAFEVGLIAGLIIT
jgi:hypothetical protein